MHRTTRARMGARLQVYVEQHRLMVGRSSVLINLDPAHLPGDVRCDKNKIKTALAVRPLHLVMAAHGGRMRRAGVRHVPRIHIGRYITGHRRLQACDGGVRWRAIEIAGENAACAAWTYFKRPTGFFLRVWPVKRMTRRICLHCPQGVHLRGAMARRVILQMGGGDTACTGRHLQYGFERYARHGRRGGFTRPGQGVPENLQRRKAAEDHVAKLLAAGTGRETVHCNAFDCVIAGQQRTKLGKLVSIE